MPNSGKLLDEPVVFFGSGPVAAKSLELLSEWADIEAVITKPKPAHHKGEFPVLEVAERLKLPVLTVSTKAGLDELMDTRPVRSRVAVLVDFGIIVSQGAIDYFELGIVNSHFSLLPEWRGADPITFSILSGQQETGVSLMLLVDKMDEGPLLAQTPFELSPATTTPELTTDLIEVSDQTLRHILPLYAAGSIAPAPQEQAAIPGHQEASYSRKLTKADSTLDFEHKPATQLEREVRAYLEWPKSRTRIGEVDVIVTRAHVLEGEKLKVEGGVQAPGALYRNGKELGFYTTDDIFIVDLLKPAGKPEMSAAAFLAGYHL